MFGVAVFLAIFPSIAIVGILALRSRSVDRTAPALFATATIGGAVAIVPLAFLLLAIARVPVSYDDRVARILSAFVRSALLEETFKLIAVVTVLRLFTAGYPRLRTPVVAIAVAAGFAGAENLLHLAAPVDAIVLRAVTSLPVHIVASTVVGLALTRPAAGIRVAFGLVVSVLFHGMYNLSVLSSRTGVSVAIAVVACLCTIGAVFFLSPSTTTLPTDERRHRTAAPFPGNQNYTRSRRKP